MKTAEEHAKIAFAKGAEALGLARFEEIMERKPDVADPGLAPIVEAVRAGQRDVAEAILGAIGMVPWSGGYYYGTAGGTVLVCLERSEEGGAPLAWSPEGLEQVKKWMAAQGWRP
jgi:hypothetical protein